MKTGRGSLNLSMKTGRGSLNLSMKTGRSSLNLSMKTGRGSFIQNIEFMQTLASDFKSAFFILIIKPTRCTNFSNVFLE
jgi:hypothetical protein